MVVAVLLLLFGNLSSSVANGCDREERYTE